MTAKFTKDSLMKQLLKHFLGVKRRLAQNREMEVYDSWGLINHEP